MNLLLTAVLLAPTAAPTPPNVVVILCDDLGFGDLGCYGHPVIRTPHLDRLASQGLRLTSCYSGAPVCSPARAALLTGRHPHRAGIRDWIPANSGVHLKRGEVTVAGLLKTAGYRTGLIGKWHLASKMDGTEPLPGDHGFDHWFATQNNAAPSHQNPINFVRNGQAVGPLTGNSTTLIIDEALRFLDGNKSGPFALVICFHAPHEPVATPDEFKRPYASEPDETKRTYFGSVALVDHEVGRLMKALDERKLADDTFVFFTSDNGPETLRRYKGAERSHGSPVPLRGMKLSLYEGGSRVPGIIRWPGKVASGKVSDEPVAAVDVLPTLCGLAGVRLPAERALDGASWLPWLAGQPLERSVPLYWQYDRAIGGPYRSAVRIGPWKLLADESRTKLALYNLTDDISETRDVSAEHPERVKELARQLEVMHRAVNGG